MNDPKKSRFVGKIGTTVAAAGNQRISLTGYAISAFSKQDPDVMFRAIMEAAKKESMRGNVKQEERVGRRQAPRRARAPPLP